MAFPLLAAVGIGAAVGGIGSFLGANEQQDAEERARRLLKDSLIDRQEAASMENRLNKGFNASIAQQSNQMAFQSRGTDSALARASMLGAAEGSRFQALAGLSQYVSERNANTRAQIASVPHTNVADATLAGVVQGGIAGAQISNLLKEDAPLDLESETSVLPEEDATISKAPEDFEKPDLPMSSNPDLNLSSIYLAEIKGKRNNGRAAIPDLAMPTKTKSQDIEIAPQEQVQRATTEDIESPYRLFDKPYGAINPNHHLNPPSYEEEDLIKMNFNPFAWQETLKQQEAANTQMISPHSQKLNLDMLSPHKQPKRGASQFFDWANF